MAPMEYPETGMGDYRESAFCMRNVTGHRASELKYKEHRILEGKPELEGLPATFGTKEECTTLQIICEDMLTKVEVCLQYTIFEEEDALTRSVLVENKGTETVYLEKVLSACTVPGREKGISKGPLSPTEDSMQHPSKGNPVIRSIRFWRW